MAEQSLGWSTNGTGDGVNGGYPEARMTSMQTNSFGSGIMFSGNRFQRSWTSTSVTVDTGACMIGGYFYENTTSATINLTSGSAGTYYLVVYLNTNASSTACVANVTANNPSAITIGAKTTRLAIVSSLTPPAGVTYVQLHNITWSGSAITAVTDVRQFVTPVTPNLPLIRMHKSTSQIITASTLTSLSSFSNKWQSTDGLMTADLNGIITLNATGVYLVDFAVTWNNNATGNRHLRLCSASENTVEVAATSMGMASAAFPTNVGGTLVPTTAFVQRASTTIIRDQVNTTSGPTYETLFLSVYHTGTSTVSVTSAQINVTRISDIPPMS